MPGSILHLKATDIGTEDINTVIGTITRSRLKKYLHITENDPYAALSLYIHNAKVNAAVMVDLHYVEVALRNKFDHQLSLGFGTPHWFVSDKFCATVDSNSLKRISSARKYASRGWLKLQVLPPGKVVAELPFGFWLQLIAARYEHSLWTPYLHKSFSQGKAPKRAVFNQQLERLRQLRNRAAHHEPVFHLDLPSLQQQIQNTCEILCPITTTLMVKTSALGIAIQAMTQFRQQYLTTGKV